MKPFCHSGKDGATLGLGFTANRDDVLEYLACLPDIEDRLGLLLRQINPRFLHDLHDYGVHGPWLQAGARRLEIFRASVVEPRFRHLAARAVMDANEQYFLSGHIFALSNWEQS